MSEKQSNYEKWCESWRLKFLAMDQKDLKSRLPELQDEGEYLTLSHFGTRYGIHRAEGSIREMNAQNPVSTTVRLNIYTLLYYAKPKAKLTNNWVPFEKLKNAGPFGPAFRKGNLEAFAKTFSGHPKALAKACEKLGGTPLPYSDVGYQLSAFDCIPIQFLFWDGDDEFEAQANILFDESATDFIHVESTVTIASVGIERLAREAGLPLNGRAFQSY